MSFFLCGWWGFRFMSSCRGTKSFPKSPNTFTFTCRTLSKCSSTPLNTFPCIFILFPRTQFLFLFFLGIFQTPTWMNFIFLYVFLLLLKMSNIQLPASIKFSAEFFFLPCENSGSLVNYIHFQSQYRSESQEKNSSYKNYSHRCNVFPIFLLKKSLIWFSGFV